MMRRYTIRIDKCEFCDNKATHFYYKRFEMLFYSSQTVEFLCDKHRRIYNTQIKKKRKPLSQQINPIGGRSNV